MIDRSSNENGINYNKEEKNMNEITLALILSIIGIIGNIGGIYEVYKKSCKYSLRYIGFLALSVGGLILACIAILGQ